MTKVQRKSHLSKPRYSLTVKRLNRNFYVSSLLLPEKYSVNILYMNSKVYRERNNTISIKPIKASFIEITVQIFIYPFAYACLSIFYRVCFLINFKIFSAFCALFYKYLFPLCMINKSVSFLAVLCLVN